MLEQDFEFFYIRNDKLTFQDFWIENMNEQNEFSSLIICYMKIVSNEWIIFLRQVRFNDGRNFYLIIKRNKRMVPYDMKNHCWKTVNLSENEIKYISIKKPLWWSNNKNTLMNQNSSF